MKFPKQKDQGQFIGKRCEFKKTLYRDNYSTKNKVTWKRQHRIPKEGWIVGFGCTYNGSFVPHGWDEYYSNEFYFVPSKRVNHIKVRTRPDGKSIKIFPLDLKVI